MFEKYIYQSLCLIVLGCVPAITQAGDYKVFGNHYAWNNNFNDKQNALTASFGTGNSASMTAYVNTTYQQLWGYPAICRGYHYGFNPASNDYLFPKKISTIKAIPTYFRYSQSGSGMQGDFAYDIFLRKDNQKSTPQLEVMIWGDNNSYPIGVITSSNINIDGKYFDLWEGDSAGGYFTYSFVPHNGIGDNRTLPAKGSLNIDIKPFFNWLQANRASAGRYNDSMYIDVIEAGYEVVKGQGTINLTASITAY